MLVLIDVSWLANAPVLNVKVSATECPDVIDGKIRQELVFGSIICSHRAPPTVVNC